MTKLLGGLALLALVGCGQVDEAGPVTCPASLPTTCNSEAATDSPAPYGTFSYDDYISCGDLIYYASATTGDWCCLKNEPAGYVPTGNECSAN